MVSSFASQAGSHRRALESIIKQLEGESNEGLKSQVDLAPVQEEFQTVVTAGFDLASGAPLPSPPPLDRLAGDAPLAL